MTLTVRCGWPMVFLAFIGNSYADLIDKPNNLPKWNILIVRSI